MQTLVSRPGTCLQGERASHGATTGWRKHHRHSLAWKEAGADARHHTTGEMISRILFLRLCGSAMLTELFFSWRAAACKGSNRGGSHFSLSISLSLSVSPSLFLFLSFSLSLFLSFSLSLLSLFLSFSLLSLFLSFSLSPSLSLSLFLFFFLS